MGLKESGLRGSLRNVSVGIDAIPDSVVDNFNLTSDAEEAGVYEDTDTLGDYYSNDLDQFDIIDTDSFVGDRSLEFGESDLFRIVSFENDGLNRYPKFGDVIKFNIKFGDEENNPRMIFGAENVDNYFGLSMRPRTDTFKFFTRENGSFNSFGTNPDLNPPIGSWLRVEIDWSDEKTATMIDPTDDSVIQTTSGTDTTFDQETGVGYGGRRADDGPFRIDGVEVTGSVD